VFNLPTKENPKLRQIVEAIKEDKKLHTYWRCSNVMAIERMGYTDHGPTHVKIVSNLALKILPTQVLREFAQRR
jgi:metal-dependent HD superfamily phosphatase/phosphodiesterase